jgi:hypothetical protein
MQEDFVEEMEYYCHATDITCTFNPSYWHPGRGSPLSPIGHGASNPGLPCIIKNIYERKTILLMIAQLPVLVQALQ